MATHIQTHVEWLTVRIPDWVFLAPWNIASERETGSERVHIDLVAVIRQTFYQHGLT